MIFCVSMGFYDYLPRSGDYVLRCLRVHFRPRTGSPPGNLCRGGPVIVFLILAYELLSLIPY